MASQRPTTERRLLELMGPYWGRFSRSLAGGLLASALDGITVVLLIPLLKLLFGTAGGLAPSNTRLERLLEVVLAPLMSGGTTGAGLKIVGLLVLGLLVKNGVSLFAKQESARVEEGMVRDLRARLHRHLLKLDLGFFQRTRGGEVVSALIADADAAKGVVPTWAGILQNSALVAISLYFLAMMSARLTLLMVLTTPVLVLLIRLVLKQVRRHSAAWAELRGQLTASVTERLGAIRLIRVYGQEETEARGFLGSADRYRKQVIRAQRYQVFPVMVSEILGGLLLIMVVVAAAMPSIVGQSLGPAVTMTFLATALKVVSTVKNLSQAPGNMATAIAGAERVFRILDLPATDVDRPGERSARFDRDLVFDRVSFRYDGDEPVLTDVSFAVSKGSTVAIVGPSGAGKTTLLDLVPRLRDPTSGEIRMDGVPLTELTRSSLRALTGVVSQDTVILNDTVLANIEYGRPGASRGDIEAAARAANATEFIGQLPEGYDTVLGERGTRLSGGQRQRIAIARALLRDPPILILDEATSALDSESERLVQEAIDRLMRDRTVLVVAHRLATVRNADMIAVLDEGRIVELGGHPDLLAAGGLYRRLYDLQFRDDRDLALPEPVAT